MVNGAVLLVLVAAGSVCGARPRTPDALPYNLVLGTQTFGSAYQLDRKSVV